MKVPRSRNPCLTSIAAEKKPASRLQHFKVDARFCLVDHGVQDNRRLVATVVLREGSSPCLTSLEPVMELTMVLE